MADFGSMFGGMATGFKSGSEIAQRNEEIQIQRGMKQHAQRKAQLEYQLKLGEMIGEALQEPDQTLRGATLDSIFKSVETETGRKVNPVVQRLLKSNPEQAQEILGAARESGMTIGDIFTMSGDPLSTAGGLIAFGKAARERRSRAPIPGVPGSPQGREAPAPAEGEPAPATGTGDQTLDRQATALRQRITALENHRNSIIENGQTNPQVIKGVDDELNRLRGTLDRITIDPRLEAQKEGRQPITKDELDEARTSARRAGVNPAAVLRMFTPGMTRQQLNDRLDMLGRGNDQPAAAPLPGPGTSAPAPAPAAVPAPQPAAPATRAPAAPAPIPITPEEKLTEKERIERRAKPLPEALARDSGMKTWGEWEDSGRRVPSTAEAGRIAEENRQRAAQSAKLHEGIRGEADAARAQLEQLHKLSVLVEKAGPTGRFVAPIREALANVAQVFGVKIDPRMDDLQSLKSTNLELATASLRNFSGPDSDKDVMRAMETNPGQLRTREANRFMIAMNAAEAASKVEKAAEAARWISQFGDLSRKDPAGNTFEEGWKKYVNGKEPTYVRAAKLLGFDPEQAKAGKLVPLGRQ